MVAGVGINVLVVITAVGILMLLLGMGFGNLHYRRRAKRLTAHYERQVQMLQQAITDRGQEMQAQQRALTHAGNRLSEQERTLQQREEELRHAQDAQQRTLDLTEECENLRVDLAEVKRAVSELEARNGSLQGTVTEKNAALARVEEEIAQSVREAEEQRVLLASTQADYRHELTLRQSVATALGAIYQRLQSGDDSSVATLPATTEHATAHDAMDTDISDLTLPNVSPPLETAETDLIGVTETEAAETEVAEQITDESTEADPSTTSSLATTTAFSANGNRPSATVDSSTKRLTEFLAGRGITITQLAGEESFDPVLNGLASFLGTHYDSVKPLYQQIKRNMQMGSDFTISLKGEPPKTISLICQFGKKLYDVALLEQYRYFRSPQYLLRAKTTRLPTAQNFFSGQWLERYIIQQVQDTVSGLQAQAEQPIDFGYVANPRITLANDQEGELDLLFHFNEQIYWIETKSGDYQQHISKYSMIARTLNLDEKHALMVLTDIPASRSAELTALFGMGVCALEEFQKSLLVTLKQDLALPRHNS